MQQPGRDLHRQRLFTQPVAAAGRRRGGCSDSARIPRGSSWNPSRDSAAPYWGITPFKGARPGRPARPRHNGTGISSSPDPYKKTCCTCFWQVLPLGVLVELVMLGDRLDGLQEIGRLALAPRRQRPVIDSSASASGTTSRSSKNSSTPRPSQLRAGPERRVERKQPRLDLGDGEAADRTGEFSLKT